MLEPSTFYLFSFGHTVLHDFAGWRAVYVHVQGRRNRGPGAGIPPTPDFDRSVNPIPTSGGRLCPPQYYSPPLPRFFRPSYGPAMEYVRFVMANE